MAYRKTRESKMPNLEKNPSFAVRTIQELYDAEVSAEVFEACQRTVTFNFPAEDASMFAAIASRFGRSTAAFGGEVFAEQVKHMFIALGPEDRRKLAIRADESTSQYMQSKGWSEDGKPVDNKTWQTYADICDRAERESQQ